MNYEEIQKLIEKIGTTDINELNLEFPDGIKIRMKKNESLKQGNIMREENKIQDSKSIVEEYKIIKSQMVGTFYESNTPNGKPLVQVGDKIKKGQVVCIIEAMKLMNEIESEYDGEILEICVKNEDVIEYGMPLFKIK